MARITRRGVAVTTIGELPEVGSRAPEFELVSADLGRVSSSEFAGRRVLLNIFPSIDTGVCAASVRRFNQEVAGMENTTVVGVSKDLPFAHSRFCEAEGIENMVTASAFRSSFGEDYGVTMLDGELEGLLARSVVVIDPDGTVTYTEQVPEIGQEPDYEAALAALR
nr:thiol peroxidase [Actinomycetales bacterium]